MYLYPLKEGDSAPKGVLPTLFPILEDLIQMLVGTEGL